LKDFDAILGDVYDCAVNPDLWPQTLERIRATLGCAYVMTGFADLSMSLSQGLTIQKLRSTSWDLSWFSKVERYLPSAPGFAEFLRSGVDVPWVQLEHLMRQRLKRQNSTMNGCVRRGCMTA
jgi:hypothetical protein